MPIPPLKHRSYGYIGADEAKENSSASRPSKKRPSWGRIFGIILYPCTLLFRLLRFFWNRRPHLSRQSRRFVTANLFRFGLALAVFGFVFLTIITAWISRDLPDPDRLSDRHIAQSTKIYDRTGEHLLYEIFASEKRTLIELDEVPKYLIDGVVATEDTRFYEHHGIRPLSMLRSVIYGIFTDSLVGGGASTITQQLVKNAILRNEPRYIRKPKEIIMALRLEQKYSKEQILKIYFNEIPYGSTNYGVEAAAQSYFGKHVSELNLEEAATLAGIPQAPTRYLNNPEALKARRDFVLERMVQEGYLEREEADAAQATPLSLEQRFGEIKAPHFVLYVKEQLVKQFDEQTVDSGGLKVITSLDWRLQQAAEAAVSSTAPVFAEAKADNTALVAIDPKTGHILSLIGSRDFFNEEIDGQFNVAIQGLRQPGSSFKPIIYAAAFEKGYTPETLLYDVVTNFAVAGKDYKPQNYNLKEYGPVTIRTALQGSLNIPAVKTLYLVGQERAIKFAERMGYSTLSRGDFGLSLVLGGGEVRLLEHTAAYGVFANNGLRYVPTSILRVENPRGDVLYEWKKGPGEKVLESTITATISNVLSDDPSRVFTFGAGSVLTLPDRPVAAKSGTTNNYVDAWTIGYTPSLVAGVWAGNTDNTPLKPGFGGGKVAGTIWNKFMREALKGTPAESFPAPPPNDAQKPVLRGSGSSGIALLINRATGNIATSSTPPELIDERTYLSAHSILHYVNKDDPRGPAPEHPENDSQYGAWESAIDDWVKRRREANPNEILRFEEPPTAYDTPESLALTPTLTVLSPNPGAVLSSRHLTADITASAPRGIARVVYSLDGAVVSVATTHPFRLDYVANALADGSHVLKVSAEDDIGNRRIVEVPFLLSAGQSQAGAFWVERNLSVSPQTFPKVLFLNYTGLDQMQAVRFYAEQNGNRTLVQTVEDFSNLFNNQIMMRWEQAVAGSWSLIAEVSLKDGRVYESDRISATVQ